ncbi:MAG: hypothetical protein K6E54_07085 [Bacteroidaceae bacterium]|nr:hypothetical protein [Bacteroidaceae bacterium]
MKIRQKCILCGFICALCLAGCKSSKEQLVGTVGEPVDIGLSVLWADHNLGATNEYEAGKFLILNTKGKKTKVVDTARKMWDGNWQMPTAEHLNELMEECRWVYDKEKKGYHIYGPNGKSIFMLRYSDDMCTETVDYWSSDNWVNSVTNEKSPYITFMYFNYARPYLSYSDVLDSDSSDYYVPKIIRPVIRKKNFRKEDVIVDSLEMALRRESEEVQIQVATVRAEAQNRNESDNLMVEKNRIRSKGEPVVYNLDSKMVIPFKKTEFDKLNYVKYSVVELSDDDLVLSNSNDVISLRFKGLLAFNILAESCDSTNATYSICYNKADENKIVFECLNQKKETWSHAYYAEKDDVTCLELKRVSGKTRLKKIVVYHSLAVSVD